MTADQQAVLAKHPTAFAVYDSDKGTHKVYHLVGQCRVALSQNWQTASMAWYEAAKKVKEDAEFQDKCREAMVLDEIERG